MTMSGGCLCPSQTHLTPTTELLFWGPKISVSCPSLCFSKECGIHSQLWLAESAPLPPHPAPAVSKDGRNQKNVCWALLRHTYSSHQTQCNSKTNITGSCERSRKNPGSDRSLLLSAIPFWRCFSSNMRNPPALWYQEPAKTETSKHPGFSRLCPPQQNRICGLMVSLLCFLWT